MNIESDFVGSFRWGKYALHSFIRVSDENIKEYKNNKLFYGFKQFNFLSPYIFAWSRNTLYCIAVVSVQNALFSSRSIWSACIGMNNRGNFWWGWASFDCFPHLDNVNRIYSICETRGVSKIWLFDSKSLKINNSNDKRTQSVEKFARKRLKFTNYGKLSPNFKNSVPIPAIFLKFGIFRSFSATFSILFSYFYWLTPWSKRYYYNLHASYVHTAQPWL